MNPTIKHISARLSLREPQIKSLKILADILDNIELSKEPDIERVLEDIKAIYPSVQDFERDFPSICFALATGVGKTRLMGAFISYLWLTGRSRHFFVLAPNLTIYEKLKEDFTPKSPKYVFRGIQDFVANPPVIITGEDYDSGKGVRQGRLLEDDNTPYINIFNISKINATENKKGATKSSAPRIKRLQETIGESYFEYLSSLPDLVILMDEAHRYRATAGATAINELKPVLGIELTATPKTIGAKPVDFKNMVYAYSLSEAMEDGYVKDPAVATRKDFKHEKCEPKELERIKLKDGIHNHEKVKAELELYARQYDKEVVKPFMLVVAQDTNHARQLRELLESDAFSKGNYKGKVAEIHSKQSGAEEDENIQHLISIEDPKESTEIVIHVNKLKEGWDVTNLYTIVPLRASASEILTEQTIGRGLRLPYGRRTEVEAVDRLTIIAHDRFQEIVDRANDPNSIIKKKIEIGDGGDIPFERPQIITVPPSASTDSNDSSVNTTPQYQQIAQATMEVAKDYQHLNDSGELSSPEIQSQITKEVLEIIKPKQGTLELEPDSVKEVVETVIKNIQKLTIDIPNIVLIPSQDMTYGFHDFDLDGLEKLNYQPVNHDMLIHHLRTNKSRLISRSGDYDEGQKLENYVIQGLIGHHLINYDEHADLLYKLAGQVVEHFKSYLDNEGDVSNVLMFNQKRITDFILKQLEQYYWETPTDYQVNVSRGFTILKPMEYIIPKDAKPQNFRSIPKNKSNVRNIIFEGFTKCCYPMLKFDSVDGELRFAKILEDDASVIRWMKLPRKFFQIEYKNGDLYEPDFVVETADAKYLCEPKMASEMEDDTVLAKKEAAERWCKHATQHAQENGGKPWHYALIPHDVITSNRSFDALMKEYSNQE